VPLGHNEPLASTEPQESLKETRIQLALVTEHGFSFPEAGRTIIVGMDTADTFPHFELERQHG
jgi:hypothetical protein